MISNIIFHSILYRSDEKVAELSYVTVLEDMGLVKAQDVLLSESSQVQID